MVCLRRLRRLKFCGGLGWFRFFRFLFVLGLFGLLTLHCIVIGCSGRARCFRPFRLFCMLFLGCLLVVLDVSGCVRWWFSFCPDVSRLF